MTSTALPYLFSPANLAAAGSFLENFQPTPASGLVRYPSIGEKASAPAAAVAVLGSAIRLSEEGGDLPRGWRLMQCEPYPVKNASASFRFEDGLTPKILGGSAAFENSFGQFVSVLWRQEAQIELRLGWAWEEVTAMHRSVWPLSGERPEGTFFEVSFEGRMLASLRRFLNVSSPGMEPVLKSLADRILHSGLIADPSSEDLALIFEEGEISPWVPGRMDHHYGRFPKNPHVSVLGVTMLQSERAAFAVSSSVPETPARLPRSLEELWDFAQSLAMSRMPGSQGLPS